MIGKLITALFNFILTIVMTIIQLICTPLNALFSSVFPDFATKLSSINTALITAYSALSWAINIVPPVIRETLAFIFLIELSMLAVMRSTHATARVWKILQKLKFW